MIVVTIINILASVAVPNYLRARDKGYFAGCKQQLVQLRFAMQEYFEDHDTFSNHGLGPYFFNNPNSTDTDIEAAMRRVCSSDWTINNIVAYSSTYTITGTARDRFRCLIKIDPNTVDPQYYSQCSP